MVKRSLPSSLASRITWTLSSAKSIHSPPSKLKFSSIPNSSAETTNTKRTPLSDNGSAEIKRIHSPPEEELAQAEGLSSTANGRKLRGKGLPESTAFARVYYNEVSPCTLATFCCGVNSDDVAAFFQIDPMSSTGTFGATACW